jgi:hypothetical protein
MTGGPVQSTLAASDAVVRKTRAMHGGDEAGS